MWQTTTQRTHSLCFYTSFTQQLLIFHELVDVDEGCGTTSAIKRSWLLSADHNKYMLHQYILIPPYLLITHSSSRALEHCSDHNIIFVYINQYTIISQKCHKENPHKCWPFMPLRRGRVVPSSDRGENREIHRMKVKQTGNPALSAGRPPSPKWLDGGVLIHSVLISGSA